MLYFILTLGIPLALTAVDQLLKWLISTNMQLGQTAPLIPYVAQLRYILNDGAAFSMMSGKQTVLIIATGLALAVLLGYLLVKRPTRRLEWSAWVLVLGGGVGNLIDRILNGVVVDYIDLLFMRFAIFNFADICVCTGVGLLVLDLLLEAAEGRKQKETHGND